MAEGAKIIDYPATPGNSFSVLCDTDSEVEWLKARNDGLGASEIGAVLGIDGRSSPLKVFCEKTGMLEPEDLSDVEAIRWGHRLEPVIAAAFAEATGRPVYRARSKRYSVLRSVDHPWALASLDYWTGEGNERWPLEIKNVNAFLAEDWINGTPDYYIAQLQQQMLVTGAERGTSACLLGGNRLLWCDVDRDIVMVRKIVHNGGTFWDRVVRRDPPEPDDSEATRKVLNRLYPQDDASTVELPMALLEIVDEWRVVKAEIKAREDRSRHLENQIKATMGDAQIGVFPGGDRVSWKTQRVKEHVVKAGTKRPLLYHPAKET